jgi:acyl carrier protein
MDSIADVTPATVQDWILEQAGKILKSESLGPQDHFLDLGGDSLTAPVLAGRIEAEFGFRPELEDIFTRPFGELAELVCAGIRG